MQLLDENWDDIYNYTDHLEKRVLANVCRRLSTPRYNQKMKKYVKTYGMFESLILDRQLNFREIYIE